MPMLQKERSSANTTHAVKSRKDATRYKSIRSLPVPGFLLLLDKESFPSRVKATMRCYFLLMMMFVVIIV